MTNQWERISKSNEFIKLDVIVGEDKDKNPDLVPMIIPLHHIKEINKIVRQDTIINRLEEQPESGKCAINLITGGSFIVPYEVEDLCYVLQALDVTAILEAKGEVGKLKPANLN